MSTNFWRVFLVASNTSPPIQLRRVGFSVKFTEQPYTLEAKAPVDFKNST